MNEIVQVLLIVAVVALAIVVLFLWLQIRSGKDVEDKDGDADDQVTFDLVPPFQFEGVGESLAARIHEAVNRMGATGDDAEENYQSSLNALRPDSAAVVAAIEDELRVLPATQYLDRWSLIQLLAELKDPSSLPLLDTLLSQPLPEELYKDPHARSSLRQETINLTTAVEATTRIASDGNAEAVDMLLKHTGHESLSVRRACVQGYLSYGGEDAREILSERLPQRDLFLLDIQRLDIKNAPQIRVSPSEMPSRTDQSVTDVPRVTPRRDQ